MTHNPQQWCRLGTTALLDITGAERLLTEHPREAIELPIAPWVTAYNAPGTAAPVDVRYAMATDLRQPVLVVTVPAAHLRHLPASLRAQLPHNERGGLLALADGLHRLYKARVTGVETLPSLVLTTTETARIWGTAERAPDSWRPGQTWGRTATPRTLPTPTRA